MNTAAAVSGLLVFIAAKIDHVPLTEWLFGNAIGFSALIAAFISLIVQWILIARGKSFIIRVLAGFQIAMILLGTTFYHYPRIILMSDSSYLSLIDNHGHDKAIQALALALLIGSVFILPALVYLIYSFQKKSPGEI